MRIAVRYGMFYSVAIYSLLSILTVHVAVALTAETSAFNLNLFYDFVVSCYPIILFFSLFIVTAVFYSKISSYLYYAAVLTTISFLLVSLYEDFNKAVLLIIFFYSVLSYFLGQGWKQTLYLACYNPCISDEDIDDATSLRIGVRIGFHGDVQDYEGLLTNWDEVSCFIRFIDREPDVYRGDVKVMTEYNGKDFLSWGKIVSYTGRSGIGIVFDVSEKKRFSWKDFYSIMDEISFTPEYLVH